MSTTGTSDLTDESDMLSSESLEDEVVARMAFCEDSGGRDSLSATPNLVFIGDKCFMESKKYCSLDCRAQYFSTVCIHGLWVRWLVVAIPTYQREKKCACV